MVGLTWFGFSRWINETQYIDEKLKQLDLKIKEQNLKKVKLEISQLKLTRISRRRAKRRARLI